MIDPLIWYQICNCNHHNFEEILNFQFSKMSSYSWICLIQLFLVSNLLTQRKMGSDYLNTKTAMAAFNLFNILGISLSIYNNVGEVFVIPHRKWWVGKIGSKAPSSQIPMMLYQKALTGVFVGAIYQRLKCRFIGHCLSLAHKCGQLGLYYYII